MSVIEAAAATQKLPSEERFRRDLAGWIITGLNVLAAANSAWFFMGVLKSGVVGWLMMNTCAVAIALFAAGFLAASPVVMTAAALIMFRYGTLGLFVFGWNGGNLFAQAGHILMTAAVVYVIVDAVRKRGWKTVCLGLLLGSLVLFPLETVQTLWIVANPEAAAGLFSGSLAPPGI